jgi:DNA-binding IclR family transcriptional regulator
VARPAPGAARSIAVLELLAAHPDERFTLSEVARRCSLNKATAHALLSALTERRVLLRHPAEKRYSLGPALVAIGDAARRGYNAADFAGPVLRRLATDTGLWARLWVVGDDHVDEVAGAGHPAGSGDRPPAHLPLVPPVGAVAMAYADTVTAEAWLARAPSAEGSAAAAAGLAAIRADGYSITRASDGWAALAGAEVRPAVGHDEAATRELLRAVADRHLLSSTDAPAETEQVRVADVTAPVFGAEGAVEIMVSVTDDDRVHGWYEARALAREVVDAARTLTGASGGRWR